MATVTTYPHIEIRDDGMAYIAGTQIKVIEVVLDKLAWDWSPEAIHRQHPHLSLAQIHAAFAYYYDHQVELDRVIAERERQTEQLIAEIQARQGESPLRAKLKSLGQIP